MIRNKTYNIVEFAKLTGVSVKTLRRLDASGDLVADRILNNQYAYDDSHIALLSKVRDSYLANCKTLRKSLPSDLKGQRFGRLVVLERAEDIFSPRGKRKSRWICQCDCGNQCISDDNSLRAGYKKSCGCLLHGDSHVQEMWKEYQLLSEADAVAILKKQCRSDQMGKVKKRPGGGKLQDLTGKKFGLWTVLERGETRHYKNGGQAVCWVCRCECGTVKTVSGRDLKSGASQSCGCLCSMSWLEFYTRMYLRDHGIEFESQKTYSDLRGVGGNMLSYDFLVLKSGAPYCVVECQGEQHYRPIKKFGGAKQLLKQQIHDNLKRNYAETVLHMPVHEVLYTAMSKDDVYAELDKFFVSL